MIYEKKKECHDCLIIAACQEYICPIKAHEIFKKVAMMMESNTNKKSLVYKHLKKDKTCFICKETYCMGLSDTHTASAICEKCGTTYYYSFKPNTTPIIETRLFDGLINPGDIFEYYYAEFNDFWEAMHHDYFRSKFTPADRLLSIKTNYECVR